jgi:hypothetical protein
MDFATMPEGLLVHSNHVWPCAVCRPNSMAEGSGCFLCLDCASEMVEVAMARLDGSKDLLGDLRNALGLCEETPSRQMAAVN